MTLYKELKRRNVFKVSAAYVIVAWLILQVGDVLAPALRLTEQVNTVLAFFIILGFPLAVFFAWVFELTPEGLKRQKDVDRGMSITHITGRTLNYWIIGLLIVALLFFAFDRFVLDPRRDAAEIEAAVQQAMEEATGQEQNGEPAPGKSIAVMPFVNMSNDPEQEFFSEGISEELLNVLARYPGLKVAARTSSFQFKGQNQDVADIARQLRVNHVLEGSVRKSGTRLRITVQLIEADTGYNLWSEAYDRELTDVFAIQDEISAAISEALEVELELATGETVARVSHAADPRAFEAYVAGRQLINQRTRGSMEKAIEALQRAVEIDPGYASAHAQLAIAYILMLGQSSNYGEWTMDEVSERATPHIDRALALDPRLAEGHAASALLALNRDQYDLAEKYALEALELNPSYADALNWLSLAYQRTGRYKESDEALARLLEVDPLTVVGRGNMSRRLARRGDMDRAYAMAEELRESNSLAGIRSLGVIAADFEGKLSEGLHWFLRHMESEPDNYMVNAWFAYILGAVDLVGESRRARNETRHWAYYAQGDWEHAVDHLDRYNLNDGTDALPHLIYKADYLYYSSDIAAAQTIMESLLENAQGRPVMVEPEASAPTARAAWGRFEAGDETGARELLALVRADQAGLARAGYSDAWYYRIQAMVDAMENRPDSALRNIRKTIENGGRDPNLFAEPALQSLSGHAEFTAAKRELEDILANERAKILKMLCGPEPPGNWQALPETCVGYQPGP